VVLLADGPLAGSVAGLPHLHEAPASPTDQIAEDRIAGLRDDLRGRQAAGDDADDELIVLVVDGPAGVDGPALRELARDGGRHGIYTLLASADLDALEPALRDACAACLVSGPVAGGGGGSDGGAGPGAVADGRRRAAAGADAAHPAGRSPRAARRHDRGRHACDGCRGG
jgi:hypothetical protein